MTVQNLQRETVTDRKPDTEYPAMSKHFLLK